MHISFQLVPKSTTLDDLERSLRTLFRSTLVSEASKRMYFETEREMAVQGFLLKRVTPTIFHPNFGRVPLGLDADVEDTSSKDPKLIIGEVT